jgi:hypothetical protein
MTPFPQSGESYVLEQQARAGASWVYWIAGISLVNVITALAGSSLAFMISMAIPMGMAGIAHDSSSWMKAILAVAAVILCAAFGLFGFFARNGARWAFIVAIFFYGVDALVWMGMREWLGVGLHAYALWRIGVGMMAAFGLAKLRKAAQMPSGYQGVRGIPDPENPGAWPAPPAAPPPASPLPAPAIPPTPIGQTTDAPASSPSQTPPDQPISAPLIESSPTEPYPPQPPSDEQA